MTNKRTFQRVLITGINGSAGSYLAEHIAGRKPAVRIHGLARWHSTTSLKNLQAVQGRIVRHECDMADFGAVLAVLKRARPDAIFHLASHANVQASFKNPLAVLNNNIMSTANLFEAVRMAGIDPVIVYCSTSEVYGEMGPRQDAIREDAMLLPLNPYAVSKTASDLLGHAYFASYGMKIVRIRMFGYVNPRRADLFASSFARQIARIEAGLQKELLHGNLKSRRTLVDVRDAVEAFWMALEGCEPGEAYNVGGTEAVSVRELLARLIKLSRVPVPTRVDPSLFRPSDITRQIPDVRKFARCTGWRPQYSLEDSLAFLLTYWRQEVRQEADRGIR